MLSSYRGDLMQTPDVESVQPPSVESVQPPSVESMWPPSVESVQPTSVESVQPPSVESVRPPSVQTQKQMSSRYLCIGIHTLETTFLLIQFLCGFLMTGSIANFQSKILSSTRTYKIGNLTMLVKLCCLTGVIQCRHPV